MVSFFSYLEDCWRVFFCGHLYRRTSWKSILTKAGHEMPTCIGIFLFQSHQLLLLLITNDWWNGGFFSFSQVFVRSARTICLAGAISLGLRLLHNPWYLTLYTNVGTYQSLLVWLNRSKLYHNFNNPCLYVDL